MKYLVNRETKEHIPYFLDSSIALAGWRVVEADDEGWIKWDGGKRPLRKDCMVEVKYSADQRKSQMAAGAYDWQFLASRKFNIFAYRPILTVESKPTLEETWHKIKQDSKVDVFTRLYEAVVASESIPALIAEINSMLPEGYEVTRK